MGGVGSAEFAGRVALVTGAARGIGRASAVAFGRRGADVVICDVLDEDAHETVAQLEALGVKAHYQRTDVSDPAQVRAAVSAAVEIFGRLDYAHNNAGTFAPAPLADLAEDDWSRVLAVNLSGVFYCLKYQIPEILKVGGAIVNTASIWGLVGSPAQAAYVAAKHGVVGLTKTAAADYGTQGIRINAVAPGTIQTAMTAAVPVEVMEMIIGRSAQKRYGQPAEIGEAVTWLCSPAASYVNGAVLPVDGGWLAA
jgi:NAD(P)-dependent dehydrogenase (short-subunit alcohol dehydrogenase family)